MTVIDATARGPIAGATAPAFGAKLIAAVGLVAAADYLFFERPLGISVVVFLTLIAAAIILTAVPRSKRALAVRASGVLALALLPLIENVSGVSLILGLAAIAAFSLFATGRLRRGVSAAVRQISGFLLGVAFRCLPDLVRWRLVCRRRKTSPLFGMFAVWIVPLGLGAVFVLLFGIANPVVESWLERIELWRLLDLLAVERNAFWVLTFVFIWGFLRPRISWFQRIRAPRELIGPVRPRREKIAAPIGRAIFGDAAILRALIVFNAIFAVETGLDIAYLWGGVALPEGMTYAAYAHRGAYPLILTALLAAAFVLAAVRDGGDTGRSVTIRALIYVWTAQNVMLVISSMLRLDLYVAAYSLTYWRVAAFIWMGMVAVGLVLIILRIALGRTNDWLMSANFAALGATLYACGFVNFAALIANWNVDHPPEIARVGSSLDFGYIAGLGAGALPAIDRLLASPAGRDAGWAHWLAGRREEIAAAHLSRMQDWRAWTFRNWRLMRYLHQHAATLQSDGQMDVSGK
ncbi:MAG: DUF4173 domain-containing protein [Rhizobiaceae bacterium]|nr:DUF4173 domain-containing protein [Rhizobiaceae bacterium]